MKRKISKSLKTVKVKVDKTASALSTGVRKKRAERAEKRQVIFLAKKERDSLLITLIGQAVKIPGIKVKREAFLRDCFKEYSGEQIAGILAKGPVEAGIPKKILKKKANQLIAKRTAVSTGASFIAGIPGGLAVAATIPADLLQFYAVAIRLAQEIAYLYGEKDLYEGGELVSERVQGQLVLYMGVMLGSTGAIKVVQFLTSVVTAQAAKKVSQKALTKTFYYPVIEAVCEAFGFAVTKETIAKGVSKVIPFTGGVVSGALTLGSMIPMAKRLEKVLEKAKYDYSLKDYEADWTAITEYANKAEEAEKENAAPAEDKIP